MAWPRFPLLLTGWQSRPRQGWAGLRGPGACWVLTWVRPREDWAGKATWEQIPRACGPGWSPRCVEAEGACHRGEAGWPCLGLTSWAGGRRGWLAGPGGLRTGPGLALLVHWLLSFGECLLKRRKREAAEPRTTEHRSVLSPRSRWVSRGWCRELQPQAPEGTGPQCPSGRGGASGAGEATASGRTTP